MSQEKHQQFRTVNPMLGVQPRLGPFPAEHIFPWTAIVLLSYLVCRVLLGLSWFWMGVIALWGISTWWILTGSKPWRFLAKFVPTPHWVRGYRRYR